MKDNHVNEEPIVTLEPFVPEEELEENLLQENPGATVDFKLIIDNICIRSEMEKWRRTSKYIEEIHKQDSSGTKARGLFKHQWDDIISNIENQYLTKTLNIEKCKHRKKIMRCDNDRT
ncbi:uncharacterized protein OCT59_023191 [Rhizophagus irregularis]|uniref:uncharacterized protein n=1 Tax=Rhizophagus irregularis TaxID=588596 RepID=UPI000CB99930|nr:hypothetical protein OCT59_023191 [Rhizophagus irregularis]GET62860.1 hypothetical protein GLOIN_2v1766197 [Rhizophagus irregularis DAOM 181602=DAOM 197198]